jgi:hypothetical protein
LLPTTAKRAATDAQRKLQRRAKDSERSIARRMQEIDGQDPLYKNIASSTGRIGHITGMQVDAISANYITENKNRKLPLWLIKAWVLINQKGYEFHKHILLHIEPPNAPKEIPSAGTTVKLSTMAVITQSRHEELIKKEKILLGLDKALQEDDIGAIRELYWSLLKI